MKKTLYWLVYLVGKSLRGEPLAYGDEGADELLLRRQSGRPAGAGRALAPQVVDGGDPALEARAAVVEGATRGQVSHVQPLPRGTRCRHEGPWDTPGALPWTLPGTLPETLRPET